MTDTIVPTQQAVSTLQLQSFGAYLALFCQDVLPVRTDQYQYHPSTVYPRFLRSWYVFQPQAKKRYVTPIASQRLYIPRKDTETSKQPPALEVYDLPCMWLCDDGRLVVSWLTTETSQLEMQLKYASGADLRSMDAHGMQRIICQLGIAVSATLDDIDGVTQLQQQLYQLDDQSYQAALVQRAAS